ncbi:MAG: ferrous iron transporter B [Candidatus Omnitrophica bacterium]|jgi:ferrous iron transport protein B|nr:ferrous iron transporter B [Candidatus Omnitrophota bacterium]
MNIILVGNANVGKSVIFNALTRSYVTVSNYPGTTVDISKGIAKLGLQNFTVYDTPGINSLIVHSEDEKVTRDILSKSDITCVVQVADSKNLKRSLVLTLELIELGLPLVLNLNMSDEAKERGISIDIKKLSQKLGIDIVETVAVTGEGIPKLKEAISRAKTTQPPKGFTVFSSDEIASLRKKNQKIEELLRDILRISKPKAKSASEFIGALTVSPISGIPILIVVLFIMYLFVGRLAAVWGVDFFENKIFGQYINPFLGGIIDKFIPIPIVKEFLMGQYGIISMAVTYAFAIIFPIVTAFFLFFGILEDSGYLPRLSVLSDKVFRIIGLNGRAILPMVLGLGCGTMATLTSRILETKKERILVSIILTLAIPCSAQLGVIMAMLSQFSLRAFLLWFSTILFVIITIGFLSSRLVPGKRSPFIQELPPMRFPQIANIIVKTGARLKWYLKEAVPLFILGTFILFVSDKIGLLNLIERVLSPFIVVWLHLPKETTAAFIIGFLRRDYGAAGLYQLARAGVLDKIQIFVSLIVITLFVPCIAQFFVTVKERGLKVALMIAGFVFLFAFLAGGLLNHLLRYLILVKGIAVL